MGNEPPPTLEDQVKALKAQVNDLTAKLEKANDRGADLSKISELESKLADANKKLDETKSKLAEAETKIVAPPAPKPEKKKPGALEGWI